ncbi:UNVERIFIED_CONTAM: hypothetical protein Slati_0435700 [Sesamum latifolium]|uniref:Uncharacterized protein n=1 Tax=Sesamum latifolium TaxID=2727402 RepID=A0AAW2Y0C0_9LAMI
MEKQLSVQVQQSVGTAGAIYLVHHKDIKHKVTIDKRSMFCDYCKKAGHLKETCFKLDGTPEWYKELTEKKRKGTGRGRGLIAAMDAARHTTVSHLQGTDISSILRTEIRKLMNESEPSYVDGNSYSTSSKWELVPCVVLDSMLMNVCSIVVVFVKFDTLLFMKKQCSATIFSVFLATNHQIDRICFITQMHT